MEVPGQAGVHPGPVDHEVFSVVEHQPQLAGLVVELGKGQVLFPCNGAKKAESVERARLGPLASAADAPWARSVRPRQ
jgi:hypothetical protein